MDKEQTWKGLFTAVGTIISWKLQVLFPLWILLVIVMVSDLILGLSAAKFEKAKYTNLPVGISSNTLRKGAIKKGVSLILLGVLFMLDVTVLHYSTAFEMPFDVKPVFSLLMTVYILASEFISLGENYCRHDNELPKWFGSLGEAIKNSANAKGDRYVEKITSLSGGDKHE